MRREVMGILGAVGAAAALAAAGPERAGAEPSAAPETELRAFAAERLRDAVRLYDERFRTPVTGQYLDAIRLDDAQETASSIAATGMGLISLAIGDRIGAIGDAERKAEATLAHLLGEGAHAGFQPERSKSGWFRHWIDPETGAARAASREKYSTIDTAILAAGAAIAGRYFKDKADQEGRAAPRAYALAERLVGSVDWSSAIRDPERGSIHLVFYGVEEAPSPRGVATIPFDEYALLPCIGASAERMLGRRGPASRAWAGWFEAAEALPMADHGDYTLLSKPSGSVPSHFTHQFAFHLCGAYARSPVFLSELRELKAADRRWFADRGAPQGLWGLGAGSELVWDDAAPGAAGQRYGVARLAKNPQMTASPAIMAGFLAVDEADGRVEILRELHGLWGAERCRYELGGLGFLWRCSARDPKAQVSRVEAIDFSTWMLGLASADPRLGLGFFQDTAL